MSRNVAEIILIYKGVPEPLKPVLAKIKENLESDLQHQDTYMPPKQPAALPSSKQSLVDDITTKVSARDSRAIIQPQEQSKQSSQINNTRMINPGKQAAATQQAPAIFGENPQKASVNGSDENIPVIHNYQQLLFVMQNPLMQPAAAQQVATLEIERSMTLLNNPQYALIMAYHLYSSLPKDNEQTPHRNR